MELLQIAYTRGGGGDWHAVELSPRRAEICAERNRENENLTIHVGNLNDINLNKKFDWITLIGVFEYAPMFTHTKNPQIDFLNKCKSFLKPNGILIIAIENRLGMKYFSGAPEDHTRKVFDGILGYAPNSGVRTFSRLELKNLLNQCGLTEQNFYYPYPDYKFPSMIHSDKMLPTAEDMHHYINYNFQQPYNELFSEQQAFSTIIDAGLYGEFSNSFLVMASANFNRKINLPVCVKFNNSPRFPQYQTRLEFYKSKNKFYLQKVARHKKSCRHIQAIVENCKILTNIYGAEHVAQSKLLSDNRLEMEYISGDTFEKYICNALENGGAEKFFEVLKFFWDNILRDYNSNELPGNPIDFYQPNRICDLDMNFTNIINQNNFVLVDYEYLVPPLPKKYMFFQAVAYLFFRNNNILSSHGITPQICLEPVKLSAQDVEKFQHQDNLFKTNVSDMYLQKYNQARLSVRL